MFRTFYEVTFIYLLGIGLFVLLFSAINFFIWHFCGCLVNK
jgi:hypothetical protein